MTETLVLDTTAFDEHGMFHFLRAYRGRKILPAVAAAEIYIHMRRQRRWTAEKFSGFLRDMGVSIEPLDPHKALAAVDVSDAELPGGLSDALIGAHALAPGRVLVTHNIRHHPHVPRKVTPAELLAK